MAQYLITNQETPIDWKAEQDTQRILQNCKNLIMTRMGEVPYDRMRGLNPAIWDMPMKELNTQILPETDRVLAWEPRAKAVSASAGLDRNGETVISVVVEV